MTTKVIHCKSDEANGPNVRYIGRPSIWGNPFSHKKDSMAAFRSETAKDAVAAYDEWIHHKNQKGLLGRVRIELKGMTLACWCKPAKGSDDGSPCHGDVLLRIANEG